MPIFTEEDPTYDDLTETNSVLSGSVNEILDGIADVQEFRNSIDLDYLEDLTIPDQLNSSNEEISTIKKKPNYLSFKQASSNNIQAQNSSDRMSSESDFINQALAGTGRLSRSNSSNQLTNSSSTDFQKVCISFKKYLVCRTSQLLKDT